MSSQNLVYNEFREDTFFVKQDNKLDGISYGVARITKKHLKTLIQCVNLIVMKYRFRHSKLHIRLEHILLPRLIEIKFITNINKIEKFGIEISKSNQTDILLGLDSFRIQRLLSKRGIEFIEQRRIVIILRGIKFTEFISKIGDYKNESPFEMNYEKD